MNIRHKIKEKKLVKNLAKESIEHYFKLADSIFLKNPILANRYVTLARKVSMKSNVSIPKTLQKKFCKHCYKYLYPTKTARIRTLKGKLVIYCFNCKKFNRYRLK
ncbi:ribonuclease P [Candidatus Woesearchaeota archaeon]|nr:ribonuclease P [Candidatus Woesearchaeota archaeon]